MNMRKYFQRFAASLAAAAVITAVGVGIVSHHNVEYADMYTALANGINSEEALYSYTMPDRTDLSGYAELTNNDYVIYQLNEFNTIETQLGYCTVEINAGTQKDVLTVSMSCLDDNIRNSTELNTAVKEGKLYIQNTCYGSIPALRDRIKIIINIPDDYKGGYTIMADKSDITFTNAESTMDTVISLNNCNFSAENITSSNITADFGGTTAKLDNVLSSGEISVSASSSDIKINDVSSQYTKVKLSSTAVDAENLSGALTYESDLSRLYLKNNTVSGNMSLNSKKGTINVSLPKNAPLILQHDEVWSAFYNNTGLSESKKNNKDLQYILETNVEFTIVTLDEK